MLNMKCLRLSFVENLFSYLFCLCVVVVVVVVVVFFLFSYDSNLRMFWTVFFSCKEIRSLN